MLISRIGHASFGNKDLKRNVGSIQPDGPKITPPDSAKTPIQEIKQSEKKADSTPPESQGVNNESETKGKGFGKK